MCAAPSIALRVTFRQTCAIGIVLKSRLTISPDAAAVVQQQPASWRVRTCQAEAARHCTSRKNGWLAGRHTWHTVRHILTQLFSPGVFFPSAVSSPQPVLKMRAASIRSPASTLRRKPAGVTKSPCGHPREIHRQCCGEINRFAHPIS